jgi:hypothetical protein
LGIKLRGWQNLALIAVKSPQQKMTCFSCQKRATKGSSFCGLENGRYLRGLVTDSRKQLQNSILVLKFAGVKLKSSIFAPWKQIDRKK